jgi:hypothetical protein
MPQLRRTETRETLEHQGRSFTLVGELWTVQVSTRWGGLGYTYQRPRLVDGGPETTTIRDHLMIARLGAIVLLTLTVFARRIRP